MESEVSKAIAVSYEPGKDSAPRVVAKGRGPIAERIIEIATEAHVPLYRDPDLVEILMAVDVEQVIPTHLYQAVAEVLAFVYRLNQDRGEGIQPSTPSSSPRRE